MAIRNTCSYNDILFIINQKHSIKMKTSWSASVGTETQRNFCAFVLFYQNCEHILLDVLGDYKINMFIYIFIFSQIIVSQR